MQVFVKGIQRSYVLDVDTQTTLEEMKGQIQSLEKVDELCLFVSGLSLADNLDMTSLHNATIDVSGTLRGGKVHGSLARAGKVRAQTPKVEPQEKKKKKTGRAKRRKQYNKRFLSAAPYGNQRGPNSNI